MEELTVLKTKLTSILQISTPARWPAFAKAGSIVVRDRCGDWERDTAADDTAANPTSTRISGESAPPPYWFLIVMLP